MKIRNRIQENEVIELTKNRDRALKKLEEVREATQGPEVRRDAKYITGQRIELKQAEKKQYEESEN